jgi:hypothetical protein
MFAPRPARNDETAATIPGRSAQEISRRAFTPAIQPAGATRASADQAQRGALTCEVGADRPQHELDGAIVAARELHGTRAIADPFVPTADLVALLDARIALLRRGETRGRRRFPRLPRLLAAG